MIGRKKRRYKRHRNIPALEPESWQLSSETKKTIIIIVIFTFALLGIISLFNGAGALGEWIHWGLGQLFGWANWIVLLLLLVLDYFLLSHFPKAKNPLIIYFYCFFIELILSL